MPVARRLLLLLLLVAPAGAGCGSSALSRPAAPRPVGLPDDIDVEADRRSVRQPRSGGGAIVDRVALLVRNRSDRVRDLHVTGVDRLHGTCDALGWDDVQPLEVHQPAELVRIRAAEALNLAIVFDPVECYNVCDRFGFRVHVEVDGRPFVIDALLDVERDE